VYEVTAGADPEEKEQARQIRLKARTHDCAQAGVLPEDASKLVHMLVRTRNSPQPIRNLAAAISVSGCDGWCSHTCTARGYCAAGRTQFRQARYGWS